MPLKTKKGKEKSVYSRLFLTLDGKLHLLFILDLFRKFEIYLTFCRFLSDLKKHTYFYKHIS